MAQLQGKIRLQTTFSAFRGSWSFGKLDGDYAPHTLVSHFHSRIGNAAFSDPA